VGLPCTLVKGVALTDLKAVILACFAAEGMILSWVFTFLAVACSFFVFTAYQC